MTITEISQLPERLEEVVDYFWNCWGSESNRAFYQDCIAHSIDPKQMLPKFYVGLQNDQIVGSYALLTNDIISRQDLMPWFACLHVEENARKQGLGGVLLNHGLAQAKAKGFDYLYLSSDLEGFYEKKGWEQLCMGYNVFGDSIKIYQKPT